MSDDRYNDRYDGRGPPQQERDYPPQRREDRGRYPEERDERGPRGGTARLPYTDEDLAVIEPRQRQKQPQQQQKGGGGGKQQMSYDHGMVYSGKSLSEPGGGVSKSRKLAATGLRRASIRLLGMLGFLSSVGTMMYCVILVDNLRRGNDQWNWLTIVAGLLIGLAVVLCQVSFSDWHSPGVIFGYFVFLGIDAGTTAKGWFDWLFGPIILHTHPPDPTRAIWIFWGIAFVLGVVGAYMAERSFFGRRMKTLVDHLKGGFS